MFKNHNYYLQVQFPHRHLNLCFILNNKLTIKKYNIINLYGKIKNFISFR
jgi:hypothetical protein